MRPGEAGSRSRIYVGDLFLDSTLASLSIPIFIFVFVLVLALILAFVLAFVAIVVVAVDTSYIGFCNLLTMTVSWP